MRTLVENHPRGTVIHPTPIGAVGLTPQEGAGLVAVGLAEDLRDCLTIAARTLVADGQRSLAEDAENEVRRLDRELA